jgi:uncharacterized membrane protein (DUF4010 family)
METIPQWPYLPTLLRLGLALGVGLFIGLERERRGKEAGMRTFGFVALVGAVGGLLGEPYSILSLVLTGVLVVLLALENLRSGVGIELTTSAALVVTGYAGVLAGLGHTFTPAVVGIVSAALLASKERLVGFSLGLTESELRAAILLGILAFVVYPVLPNAPVDPWGLVNPQATWLTIILIAAIGFVNYVLLKLYGAQGIEVGTFLGGLVNSSVAVTDLALRVRAAGGRLARVGFRGVLLTTAAMLVRNAALLLILDRNAFVLALTPLALMLLVTVGVLLADHPQPTATPVSDGPGPSLQSPFSLQAALKFGLIFLGLQVAGGLAERALGQVGFYAISVVGGLVSSASAVASAASLGANGTLAAMVAGTGAVLASIASTASNLVIMARYSDDVDVSGRAGRVLALTAVLGGLVALGQLAVVGCPWTLH